MIEDRHLLAGDDRNVGATDRDNRGDVTRAVDPRYVVPSGRRSVRGGSFLRHASYCHHDRIAARGSNTPESTASNSDFRVVGRAPGAGGDDDLVQGPLRQDGCRLLGPVE